MLNFQLFYKNVLPILLLIISFSNDTLAHNARKCHDKIFRGMHESQYFEISSYDAPFFSDRFNSIVYGMHEWNVINGMWDPFKHAYSDSTKYKKGRGHWNVSYVSKLDGGGHAKAFRSFRLCSRAGNILDGRLTGCSVVALEETRMPLEAMHGLPQSDLNTYPYKEGGQESGKNIWTSYLSLFTHEFGHCLGMDHEKNDLSIMFPENRPRNGLYYGDRTFAPSPDDLVVPYKYYASGNQSWDWAALSWSFNHDTGVAETTFNEKEIELCYGDFLPMKWTLQNRGNQINAEDQKLRIDYVLSSDTNITDSDPIMYTLYAWNWPNTWSPVLEGGFVIPSRFPQGEYYAGIILDRDNEFTEYRKSNNRTYLKPKFIIRDCSGDPSVSDPINTVSYHHVNRRINYLVKDFPTNWNPKEIVLQVQPTDGNPLEGRVLIRYNGQSHELSGWYTDIKVPFPVKLPVLFEIITDEPRDIRLEWWALDNDYFSHRINRTPPEDPDCLVTNCIPLKKINTPLPVSTEGGTKTVRISGFPESWDPQSIVVGIHNLNSDLPLPSGYFRVFSKNNRFVQTFYIPQGQYYYEVKIPYTGEGHLDLDISSEIFGGGYLISWWPVTN